MVNILIANDSLMVQEMLKRVIRLEPDFKLVGIANDGEEAVEAVQQHNPDVVLMDINMPKMDGVEATRRIVALKHPCQILVVTASLKLNMSYIFDCLSFGAVEAIKTPIIGRNEDFNLENQTVKELIDRIKIISNLSALLSPKKLPQPDLKSDKDFNPRPGPIIKGKTAETIIAIGASTGGPQSLAAILQALPADLRSSMVLIQHIDADFAPGLAEWLDKNCDLDIYTAKAGDQLIAGTGYLCAGGKNLILENDFTLGYQFSEETLYAPSIDVTFESVAKLYGSNAIGVLLTGMGKDGAQGLKAIRDAGGRTIAQDEASSLIYGMPKAAKEIGAAEFILSLEDIADKILFLIEQNKMRKKHVA